MKFDLHSHTNCSDGALTPAELVKRAAEMAVDVLAITDHDTIAAHQQLAGAAPTDIEVIAGIEFSTQWRKTGVHIVGLNIQLDSEALVEGVAFQQRTRHSRAQRIGEKLEKLGFENAFHRAAEIADNDNIGRPHFAEHLVEIGAVSNFAQAFKKYLGNGKRAYVNNEWASLPQVIEWIRSAGGTAVLAHPTKYKLSRSKIIALLDDFVDAGGQAMEIVSGKQLPQQTRDLVNICNQKNLLASVGSDFHRPGQQWAELGCYSAYPEDCTPVWQHW